MEHSNMEPMEPLDIFDSVKNRHVKIFVKTEIANRCKTDDAFAQDLYNKLQEEELQDGSSIEIETVIKAESDCTDSISIISDEDANLQNKEHFSWSRRETLKFLKTYQNCMTRYDSSSASSRKYFFARVSEELASQNIVISADKCQQKWKNLSRTYNKLNNEKSQQSTRFGFFLEMQNVFNGVELVLSESDSEGDDFDQPFLSKFFIKSEDEALSDRESWTADETIAFLNVYQKFRGKKKLYSRDILFWNAVSVELTKQNVNKPALKCATKWKNLYRSYKTIAEKQAAPSKFLYFDQVQSIVNSAEIPAVQYIPMGSTDHFYTIKTEDFPDPREICSWSSEETLRLIAAYKIHKDRFSVSPTKHVWKLIAKEFGDEEGKKTVDKCMNKWKSLMRAFKKQLPRNCKNGNKVSRFYFYKDMVEALGEDYNFCKTELNESINENNSLKRGEYLDLDENTSNLMDVSNIEFVNTNESSEHQEPQPLEEIIIETEMEDDSFDLKSVNWTLKETAYLIQEYGVQKKNGNSLKHDIVWTKISNNLKRVYVNKSAKECETKWNNLLKMYKIKKKNKLGSDQFIFYTSMDNILKDDKVEETEEDNVGCKKCKCYDKRMMDKQTRHLERMRALKRKLDLEERKVIAFENYLKHIAASK